RTPVGDVEESAFAQARADSREVIAGHHPREGVLRACFGKSLARERISSRLGDFRQWDSRNRAGADDAGNRADLFQPRVDERHALLEVAIAEQGSFKGQEVFAADSEVEPTQVLKRLQQQSSTRQQRDCESRLDDDERMLEPSLARAGTATAAVAQSFLNCEPRTAESGRESKRQSGGDGYARGKRQHAPIESQMRGGHCLRYQRLQKPHHRYRERESGDGAESRKRQALDQKLCDQSP